MCLAIWRSIWLSSRRGSSGSGAECSRRELRHGRRTPTPRRAVLGDHDLGAVGGRFGEDLDSREAMLVRGETWMMAHQRMIRREEARDLVEEDCGVVGPPVVDGGMVRWADEGKQCPSNRVSIGRS
jgi:hypothetical protein